MMMRTTFLLLIALLAIHVSSANDSVPPARQDQPLLLTGATLHPVSAPPVSEGQMLVVKGRITSLGPNDGRIRIPPKTREVSLKGLHVYPGLIAANSVLGLTEINAVRATADMREPGEINPNARAQVSINPDSELIPVTRANGVLASLAVPRSHGGGLIGGKSALIRLDGWTWEDMTIQAPVGMHLYWPPLRTYSRWTAPDDEEALEKLRKDYQNKVDRIRNAFADARAYEQARKSSEPVPSDLRWDAMLPVLRGELPLFIHAQTVAQIRNALHFAATEGVDAPIIVGGHDAWRLTKELRDQKASVILSPINALPIRRWEAFDTPYVTPLKLHQAGVPFCIANSGTSFEAANERNLPYQAARAVAHGLPHDVALKSITLLPARILGVENDLGSLEPGKEATFFVTDGDPLEVTTTVKTAYIQGREIDLASRHTRLYQKYQEKYRQKNVP